MSTSERPRRAEQRARTREKLVDAALELMAERGFDACSIDTICAHAGLTRGAFHYNFDSREDLLAAAMATRLREWTEAVDVAREPIDSLDGWIKAVDDTMHVTPAAWARAMRQYTIRVELVLHALRHQQLRAAVSELFAIPRDRSRRDVENLARLAGIDLPLPSETLAIFYRALEDGLRLHHLADPDVVPLDLHEAASKFMIDAVLALGSPKPKRPG